MKLAQTPNRLFFHKYYSYHVILIVLGYLLLISSSCEKVHSTLIINKTGKEYKVRIKRLHYIDSAIILENKRRSHLNAPKHKDNDKPIAIIYGRLDTCFEFILKPNDEVVLEHFSTLFKGNGMSYGIGSIELNAVNFHLKAEKEEVLRLFNGRINEKIKGYNVHTIQ